MNSLLQVASVNLVVTATLASLNALGLHQHGFSVLLVASVMLGENSVLVILDHLNPGLLQTLSNEHLKYRLNLQVKVKKIWIDVFYLNSLVCAFFIWDISRAWRSINVVVWLNLRLIDHIITIIKFNPVMHWLHHLLLLLLLVNLFHLLLLLLF